MSEDIYLIWSHEHGAWWGPGGCGYTKSLTEAGRYDQKSALAICIKAVPGTSQRMGALPELPVRLEDAEAIRDAFFAQYPGIGGGWV